MRHSELQKFVMNMLTVSGEQRTPADESADHRQGSFKNWQSKGNNRDRDGRCSLFLKPDAPQSRDTHCLREAWRVPNPAYLFTPLSGTKPDIEHPWEVQSSMAR